MEQATQQANRQLSAKTEPFDSYWQAPDDVEKGYSAFNQYYRHNCLKYIPTERSCKTLVISCGPGYLLKLLRDEGYSDVLGIDSDPAKIKFGADRGLDCRAEQAFPYLQGGRDRFDLIICEQEINHLTKDEMVDFLRLCHENLRPGGTLYVYGLNGANPITGPEALAQNFDHFNTLTEYSFRQVLEHCDFTEIRVVPLKLYVFYRNPLNYVGMAVTGALDLFFRISFKLYGKSNRIFTKKIAAVCKVSR